MERRYNERQTIELQATVAGNNHIIRSKTLNISHDGIFVVSPPYVLPIYTPVKVAISIKHDTLKLTHILSGFVVRSTEAGLALTYVATDMLENAIQSIIDNTKNIQDVDQPGTDHKNHRTSKIY